MGSEKKYYLGFNLVKGIGPVRLRNLIDYFGDIEAAWNADRKVLVEAGISEKILKTFIKIRSDVDLDLILDNLRNQNIKILTWDEAEYPKRLWELELPPPVLYVRGTVIEDDEWAVGIVGTRRVTPYGRQIANELGSHLARNGVTVVSGLARGVDTIAHRSSLSVGGRTLAVLGCGVDKIYPPENRNLVKEIIQNGAIISDYPVGTPPDAGNFPPRNRIISGLSQVVVVIEGNISSGALITAKYAVDQGREVFAVPGSILAPQSKGPNWLIQQGARPLLAPKDVLEFLDISRIIQHKAARKILPSNEVEVNLLTIIGDEPIHIDDIGVEVDLSVSELASTLAMMELKGLIRQVGGMHYVVLREFPGLYEVE